MTDPVLIEIADLDLRDEFRDVDSPLYLECGVPLPPLVTAAQPASPVPCKARGELHVGPSLAGHWRESKAPAQGPGPAADDRRANLQDGPASVHALPGHDHDPKEAVMTRRYPTDWRET